MVRAVPTPMERHQCLLLTADSWLRQPCFSPLLQNLPGLELKVQFPNHYGFSSEFNLNQGASIESWVPGTGDSLHGLMYFLEENLTEYRRDPSRTSLLAPLFSIQRRLFQRFVAAARLEDAYYIAHSLNDPILFNTVRVWAERLGLDPLNTLCVEKLGKIIQE